MGVRPGIVFALVIVVAADASFRALQPKWNWEEVILSRNGPSTTTEARPKFWSETLFFWTELTPRRSYICYANICIPMNAQLEKYVPSI
jgi:hypothetical protein